MKTIIYLLVAILLFGIIATGFTKSVDSKKITIQSVDTKISSASLSKTAEIITNRLKNFSSEKFDVVSIPSKNQIQVTLFNDRDLKFVNNLICQKGAIEFYETYVYRDLNKLFNPEQLLSLLHRKVQADSSPIIGCTSSSDVKKIDSYLNSLELNRTCKFMWNDLFNDSEVCLYALKLEKGNGILLSNKDIQSFYTIPNKNKIEFKLKEPSVKLWSDITKRNINKSIAVVLDNKVLYAPLVKSEMNNGLCEISGNFTPDQLRYIVAIGNNGELPASFKVLN